MFLMMLIISIHPMCLLVNYVETPFRLLMKKVSPFTKIIIFTINCTTGGRHEEGPRTFHMYDLP